MALTGWSLHAIDETDIESLIPFVFRYPEWMVEHQTGTQSPRIYADQAPWLRDL